MEDQNKKDSRLKASDLKRVLQTLLARTGKDDPIDANMRRWAEGILKRKPAGRPSADKVRLVVYVERITADRIRSHLARHGTLGRVLDAVFAKLPEPSQVRSNFVEDGAREAQLDHDLDEAEERSRP